jgi:uncharacterized protein HemX
MSHHADGASSPALEPAPLSPKPRVPTPPLRGRRQKHVERRQKTTLWAVALVLGLALGAGGYRWVKPIKSYVDYWVTRAVM